MAPICASASLLDPCFLSLLASSIPAALVALYILLALPIYPRYLHILKRPFQRFITLDEAKAILSNDHPPPRDDTAHQISPGPKEWQTALLSIVPALEMLIWVTYGGYNLYIWTQSADVPAWTAFSPLLHAVPWLFASFLPLLRPVATPPYDLFGLHVLFLGFGVTKLGVRLFEMTAFGVGGPVWWVWVGLAGDVIAPLICVGVIFAMPVALPSNEEEAQAIGVTISPEDYTTLFQWWTFNWVAPLVWKGTKSPLGEKDVWELTPTIRSRPIYTKFGECRQKTLLRTIIAANSLDLIIDLFLTMASITFEYSSPFFLKLILEAITNPTRESRSLAFVYAVLALFATLLKAEVDILHLWHNRRAGTRIRSELMAAIYEKALRRKDFSGITSGPDNDKGEKTNQQASVGKIVQLMSADAERINFCCVAMYMLYSAPVEIVIASVFLYKLLGWSAFAGFVVLLVVTPLNTWISKKAVAYSRELSSASDRRMGVLNELIGAIKFIKFFAWEPQWIDRAMKTRQAELHWIIKRNIIGLGFSFIFLLVPVFISVISFYVYIAQGNELSVATAFTAIALFGMLRQPLNMLPNFIVSLLQTGVSVDRIDAFLHEGEVPDYVSSLKRPVEDPSALPDTRLGAEGATFRWNEQDVKKQEPVKPKSRGLFSFSFLKGKPSPQSNGDTDSVGGSTVTREESAFELADVDVVFPVGKLSIVTGPTASGKTALLMALLGEMTLIRGKTYLPKNPSQVDSHGLRNHISYAAQTAWLEQQSIKENILFGSPLEEERYDAVVEACALKPDFEILEDGDQTEIGARGVALSGGQKARVALARAVYARTKHVLLDDPLAALDSHSARYIFEHLFLGPLMEHRTVVLVSNHVELVLPSAYYLVRMLDGRIDTKGTIKELREKGVLDKIVLSEVQENKEAPDDGTADGNTDKAPDAEHADPLKAREQGEAKKARQLVKEEARAKGRVALKIYKTYFDASSTYIWIIVLFGILASQGLGVAEKYWIKVWGEHYDPTYEHWYTITSTLRAPYSFDISSLNIEYVQHYFTAAIPSSMLHGGLSTLKARINSTEALSQLDTVTVQTLAELPSATRHPYFYVGVYAGIGVLSALIMTVGIVIQYVASYRASKWLFSKMLSTVIRAPIRWFDVTPSGRILNRLSGDISTIDGQLGFDLRQSMSSILEFFAAVLTVGVVLPPFLAPAMVIGYIYYKLSLGYVTTGRDLRRMEANTKSPIFSGFAELLDGVVTVRSFSAEHRFFNSLHEKIDATTNMTYCIWMLNRWMLLRFDSLGALAVFLTTLIGLLGWVDVGLAGLTITSAMTFTGSVYWTCRQVTQLEMDLNSVERIVEYLDLPAEPPAIIESNRPPASWPSQSRSGDFIIVENLVVKYAPELPPVLHGVSFKLAARERIGLIGRTGSGKSTLAMSLLRFVEPTSGQIIIDGIDITKIGLHDLRSAITIIPQDALLFSGTIRDNLDPFHESTDEECYDALHRVQLIGDSSHASRTSSRIPSYAGSRAPSPTDEADRATSVPVQSEASATVVPDDRIIITLETQVSTGGSNFSQGQRQLIAMARALLRQSSVIIMDEATASVDFETDSKIQTAIREEFRSSLLLTVAHRIRTIIDYDRLIVLDAGRLVEFDTPHALLQKDTGIFKEMCLQSGMYQELVEAAEKKAQSRP